MTPTAQELREATEVSKELESKILNSNISDDVKFANVLTVFRNFAQSVLSASELPEEKTINNEPGFMQDDPDIARYKSGFNEALRKSRPVVERLKIRVRELEEKLNKTEKDYEQEVAMTLQLQSCLKDGISEEEIEHKTFVVIDEYYPYKNLINDEIAKKIAKAISALLAGKKG